MAGGVEGNESSSVTSSVEERSRADVDPVFPDALDMRRNDGMTNFADIS